MANKNLVIVESPAKAKTIQKFLGSEFVVKSSFGHIRDLPKKGLSIDKDNAFSPTYEIPADKKKVVSELRKEAKDASMVWLASDEDREGEAIAWHLSEALKLKPENTKRIVFHEITRPAIENAVKNPRNVDINLVNAQQARRVLDRLVGYELSPVLWKKVQRGLSAGRVQSVAVRLIVERERDIKNFESTSQYKITAVFSKNTEEFNTELNQRFDLATDAEAFLKHNLDSTYSVVGVTKKDGKRTPGAPFTTSTLQQEASRKLGFSVKQTMTIAQKLYEGGHITYMRTDSTNLSGLAIDAAKNFITSKYGAEYSTVRQFKTKNESAQEAHEAIRPTSFVTTEAGEDERAQKLYRLIWQRALASQMSPAKTAQTTVDIAISGRAELFQAKGEILLFDGFMRVYGKVKDDTLLPELNKGDSVDRKIIKAEQVYSKPPARYSEASLVKALEEMGIGRPSTYAPTISTIQDRGYVEKRELEGTERTVHIIQLAGKEITETHETQITGADRGKLLPTHLAEMTTDFLVKYFAPIVDYSFTANAEADFDKIADGHKNWPEVIADFYKDFTPLVKASETVTRSETSQAREIGTDPKSGEPIFARYGRFGPMLQKGSGDNDIKPIFAPMPAGASIDTVTLEQALEMYKLPRTVGTTKDGEEIKANIGRFGPYIQVGKTYVSIKPLDPMSINEEEARQMYEDKLNGAKNNTIQDFGAIKVVKGPYGPYITNGKKNARIPKDADPSTITEAECFDLIAKAPEKKARRFTRKKKA
jgi:DNA topoisomerase I